jgi:hypothetical protein
MSHAACSSAESPRRQCGRQCGPRRQCGPCKRPWPCRSRSRPTPRRRPRRGSRRPSRRRRPTSESFEVLRMPPRQQMAAACQIRIRCSRRRCRRHPTPPSSCSASCTRWVVTAGDQVVGCHGHSNASWRSMTICPTCRARLGFAGVQLSYGSAVASVLACRHSRAYLHLQSGRCMTRGLTAP